ncbi:MAG: hypothetical protein ABIJ75_00005 [Actinomycetota bacterium]
MNEMTGPYELWGTKARNPEFALRDGCDPVFVAAYRDQIDAALTAVGIHRALGDHWRFVIVCDGEIVETIEFQPLPVVDEQGGAS